MHEQSSLAGMEHNNNDMLWTCMQVKNIIYRHSNHEALSACFKKYAIKGIWIQEDPKDMFKRMILYYKK